MNEYERLLRERLASLGFPCYLVVHGPARDYRTRFRSEHHGVFASGMVSTPEEAFSLADGTNYPGLLSEMELIAISIEDGELKETTL